MSSNGATAPIIKPSLFEWTQEIVAIIIVVAFIIFIGIMLITGNAAVSTLLTTLGTVLASVVAYYFAKNGQSGGAAQ